MSTDAGAPAAPAVAQDPKTAYDTAFGALKDGRYAELWNMQQGIFRKRKAEPAPQAVAAVVEEDDDGESITY